MKQRTFLWLLILSLILAIPTFPSRADTGWINVGPGIDYQQFQTNDPNNIYVARMDRNNPSVTLESSIAQGRLAGGREKVSFMARRYDQAINNWGGSWGSRNKVVVAINGYFFDSTSIWRGQVQSGWYAKRFDDRQNGSGFAWTLDRNAFIGECISHPSGKQIITYAGGEYQYFQGINVARGENELIVYTAHYDADTNTDSSGVEVLVEVTTPTLIGQDITGYVREVRRNQGSTPIPFDHIVLSASGDAANKLYNNAVVGEEIHLYQELRNFSEYDCKTPLDHLNWARTYASIGGSFYFLKNSQLQRTEESGANIRNPRTAIAFNDAYIYFVVVDGRNPGVSVGMTMAELGRFIRDTLGATYAINQDGGGSSTMVVNGQVMNLPSDGLVNTVVADLPNKVFLPVVGKTGEGANQPLPPPPDQPIVERPVANGMLMVVVEPRVQSSAFLPGDPIVTLSQTDIRLGPGTNYPVLATFGAGSAGTIQEHMNGLNGVLAKGSYWWKVNIGGVSGWAPEELLGR